MFLAVELDVHLGALRLAHERQAQAGAVGVNAPVVVSVPRPEEDHRARVARCDVLDVDGAADGHRLALCELGRNDACPGDLLLHARRRAGQAVAFGERGRPSGVLAQVAVLRGVADGAGRLGHLAGHQALKLVLALLQPGSGRVDDVLLPRLDRLDEQLGVRSAEDFVNARAGGIGQADVPLDERPDPLRPAGVGLLERLAQEGIVSRGHGDPHLRQQVVDVGLLPRRGPAQELCGGEEVYGDAGQVDAAEQVREGAVRCSFPEPAERADVALGPCEHLIDGGAEPAEITAFRQLARDHVAPGLRAAGHGGRVDLRPPAGRCLAHEGKNKADDVVVVNRLHQNLQVCAVEDRQRRGRVRRGDGVARDPVHFERERE